LPRVCVSACLRVCSGYFGVGICVVGLCVVVAVWWGCVWLSLCGCWTVSPCRGVALRRRPAAASPPPAGDRPAVRTRDRHVV